MTVEGAGGFNVGTFMLSVLLLAACGGGADDGPAAAPSPTVDRYALYVDLVEREAALVDPPSVSAREADDLAVRVCASTQDQFHGYLTAAASLSDSFKPLNSAILDRRMFVIAYCDDRLPAFDAAASQVCADAVPVVGANCPGKFSTLAPPT